MSLEAQAYLDSIMPPNAILTVRADEKGPPFIQQGRLLSYSSAVREIFIYETRRTDIKRPKKEQDQLYDILFELDGMHARLRESVPPEEVMDDMTARLDELLAEYGEPGEDQELWAMPKVPRAKGIRAATNANPTPDSAANPVASTKATRRKKKRRPRA